MYVWVFSIFEGNILISAQVSGKFMSSQRSIGFELQLCSDGYVLFSLGKELMKSTGTDITIKINND